MKKILVFVLACFTLIGCKENDLIEFGSEDAYISFALSDMSNRPKERFLDSTYYSFSTDTALNIREKTLAIPVAISGVASSGNRNFSYEVAAESDYDASIVSISEPVIAAGKYVDTLFINIKRSEQLKEKEMTLILKLKESESFKVGHQYNSKLKIVFSDVLVEPSWWVRWVSVLGPYYKEVYQKWMQIYYLGADMSPDIETDEPGPVYYWDNMPFSPNASWSPITFMYISVLKQYFEENVVYPNGDTTKDRILLP